MRAFILATLLVLLIAVGFVIETAGGKEADVPVLLEANDIATLEAVYADWQSRFEQGTLTEVQMRDAYRNFYWLDATAANNLMTWAKSAPKSYAAHAALGVYLKKMGQRWRGGAYISDTANSHLVIAMNYFAAAKTELETSLSLTDKPYMSVFHLMDIALYTGDRAGAVALMASADKMLPGNTLARGVYSLILEPKWGGSYAEFDAYIAAAKAGGASAAVVNQLTAIEEDDRGATLWANGNREEGGTHLAHALSLGKGLGDDFIAEFLTNAARYGCQVKHEAEYCAAACATCGGPTSEPEQP